MQNRWGWALGAVVACVAMGSQAQAESKLYKYDQFADSIDSAATQLGAGLTSAQAGYVKGEAFGVIFSPSPGDYPVTITSLDLVVPGVCVDSTSNEYKTAATIEMWFGEGAGPAPPQTSPDWQIDTTDLLVDAGAGSVAGTYLEPNTALHITFDQDDPGGHPPQVFSGRIWVAIRFPLDPKDLASEWGACQAEGGSVASGCAIGPGQCGCQPVGTLHDGLITPNVNIINHTAGGCTGPAVAWSFMEKLGIKGDVVMRLGVQVPEGACVPNCTGKACGYDGCGGSCGVCGGGGVCSQGTCIPGGCTPACSGKDCGDDGCGGECGTCGSGQSCIAGTCTTCAPSCAGKVCGGDGCGGTCGTCAASESCNAGACEAKAAPCLVSCAGKVCGDDGCGGTCGTCGVGLTCEVGACVKAETGGPAPLIDSVSPNFGVNTKSTEIAIAGTGFRVGVEARLGATRLGIIELIGTTLIQAVVPEAMDPGTYDLTVINTDETTTTLRAAFVVGAEASSGCSGAGARGAPLSTGGLALLAVGLLAVGAWRRRGARG